MPMKHEEVAKESCQPKSPIPSPPKSAGRIIHKGMNYEEKMEVFKEGLTEGTFADKERMCLIYQELLDIRAMLESKHSN
jgi:hypothetical protein